MSVTRADFLKPPKLTIKQIDVPGLGKMYIRDMLGGEREQFEAAITDDAGAATGKGIRALLVSLCACDKDGERLFSEADLDLINTQPAKMLIAITEEIVTLNGLKSEEVEGNSQSALTE